MWHSHAQALASALASHYGESDPPVHVLAISSSSSNSSISSSDSSDKVRLLHETLYLSVGTVPLGVQGA
eukprot:21416-Heterococcus_DN1.PRE.5